ncbi:MAG: urocanate hydratase [Defluviicoccus sp.]|nr:urocanate hydratase [Defluviicoccus sp.]MDE0382305.1 urocanate hydratase [Defluviicoccus sp.]
MRPAPNAPVRAPRGTELHTKGWPQEAAYRLLMNNLEVAEDWRRLIVYGGRGKAARDWESYYRIVETLEELDSDETLVVQSGKPVAVWRTHEWAPRVLISNAMLVPYWSTLEHFNELEAKGLTMYGQMTAGSWCNIGSQGIVQGTYETFATAAKMKFGGTLKGRITVTGGLGMFSGIMPHCIRLNGGVSIAVEIDPERIQRRVELGFVDEMLTDPDEAYRLARHCAERGEARAIAVLGNMSDVLGDFLEKGTHFDIVTDQTSAHDMLEGYVPGGMSLAEALDLRKSAPDEYIGLARASAVRQVRAMVEYQRRGALVFDYGNNIRQEAYNAGYKDAFAFPGFVEAFIRPLFCVGRGPFRWICLSGEESDLRKTEQVALSEFADDEVFANWVRLASEHQPIEGLPARLGYLGFGQRARFGKLLNDMVRSGELAGPVAMSRDHLDTGSVASPNRETERMKDGSDAVADWPILNAMLNVACGATYVAVHNGGGVGVGYATHAGLVMVADGTDLAERKIERCLTVDPGSGVVRHADAGYETAIELARSAGIRMPMLGT